MGPGAWLWDQRGDKATRGHKYDRNMSPDQGTSGSPGAAVPEVPKTPCHPPSPKSPPLAEVLLAPGLWRPPGTGVALLRLELLVLHNGSCPSVQPRTPCVLALLGEHHPRTAQDPQLGAVAARAVRRQCLQLAALQLGGCTAPQHPPSTSLTLCTSQHLLTPRKQAEGDPQTLSPIGNAPSPSGPRPRLAGLAAAESQVPRARQQDMGPARQPPGHC